jgi:predicted nucleotidyltransferase
VGPERLSEPARSTALHVAEELAERGARAVVLVGSHATGDASPESDLDLLAIGPQSYSWNLQRRGDLLVSVSSSSFERYQESFSSPEEVCAVVPGWRGPVILHDPEGLAAALAREAREWDWGPLERRCDAWVAERITDYAEEVLKLVAALRRGNTSTAAVQRSLLAVHLAPVLAVHRRILYGSENRLWDLVSDAMGEEWRREQAVALTQGDESFRETCAAALRLYGLAAGEIAPLLDDRQREVVDYALSMVGRG